MTVRDLIEKLEQWPQGTEVKLADEMDDFHAVRSVTYWTAYNHGYVVIGWFGS